MINWDEAVLAPLQEVFGEPVTYTTTTGQSIAISGVFDEAYHPVDGLGGSTYTSTAQPVLGIRAAALPFPPLAGDVVAIQRTGIVYSVADVHPDGHGAIKLMLNYVSGG
ncbi:head-tail joining protein [Chromobacterium sp. CV08]|uniref:head-tail joining protein n=1 Tax=Chromobacterium sp. CV08 TaxID=3133274 RepID=UPI003DAA2141